METCYEPRTDADAGRPDASALPARWEELLALWQGWRDQIDSEWSAARAAALGGSEPARKWLGWALYRLATRVNPEIHD